MGFAFAMGSCVPYSVSLLNDLTMPNERGIAQSLFASGMYLGAGLSSFTVLMDEKYGWRWDIRIISFICWAMVLPMFFVPEPVRNQTN